MRGVFIDGKKIYDPKQLSDLDRFSYESDRGGYAHTH